ncbi:MAG TPA: DinB family protein [Thermomicrobiales bacterium]|jgi:hypothetical protein
MSARAETLARQFEDAHQELLTLAESLTDDQWRTHVPAEQCTVAALVHHVAVAYPFEIRAFTAIANGAPRAPLTWETLAHLNAEDAGVHADCDRTETLALLTRNATQAAAAVRSFTDDQLARSGAYLEGMPALTVDQWLRHVLVGHITGHLASIRAVIGLPSGGV